MKLVGVGLRSDHLGRGAENFCLRTKGLYYCFNITAWFHCGGRKFPSCSWHQLRWLAPETSLLQHRMFLGGLSSSLALFDSTAGCPSQSLAMSLVTLTARASGPAQLVRAAGCSRAFSVLNRPPPRYPGHVPLTRIERAALAVGSGLTSFFDPYRGGEI